MKQKDILSKGKDLSRPLEIMAPAGNFECLQAPLSLTCSFAFSLFLLFLSSDKCGSIVLQKGSAVGR